MNHRRFPHEHYTGYWSLLLVALLLMILLANWLVLSSKIFYFWDNRAYQQMTFHAWQAMEEGFKTWLRFIRSTLHNDYNSLFTLPLAPAMALLGPGRLVYILSVAILYFFPFACLCGLIGRELCATRSLFLSALITLIVLSLAAPWLALLLGYPDFAAALALAGAIYVYLKDRTLQQFQTLFGMAGLVALSILLRRHFAYGGLAFYGAAGVASMALRWHQQGFRLALLNSGWKLGLAGIISMAVMYLIAPEFTRRALLENYREVYASYWRSLDAVFQHFDDRLGLLGPLLALGGYLYAWWRRLLDGYGLTFIALLGGFWLLLWLTLVRQNGPQYILHVFPLWLGVGQGLLVYALWQGRRWRQAFSIIAVALIALSFANTFWLHRWAPSEMKAILPDPIRPLSDHAFDYEQYGKVLNTLLARMQNGERLYLAASHGAINRDVLLSAEEQLHGTYLLQRQTFATADVDSRDWTPLSELLQADFIAFTVPFIPHLPAQEQDLVRVVMQAFVEAWPFSRDFELVEQFHFQAVGGFQLQLYQRFRPTDLNIALDTLWRMRTHIEPIGWQQQSWLNLSADADWRAAGRLGEPAQLNATSARPIRLAYYPAVSGEIKLQSHLETTGCSGSRLELMTWNPALFATQHSFLLQADMQQDWTVQLQQNDAATLVLALTPAGKACEIALARTQVISQ